MEDEMITTRRRNGVTTCYETRKWIEKKNPDHKKPYGESILQPTNGYSTYAAKFSDDKTYTVTVYHWSGCPVSWRANLRTKKACIDAGKEMLAELNTFVQKRIDASGVVLEAMKKMGDKTVTAKDVMDVLPFMTPQTVFDRLNFLHKHGHLVKYPRSIQRNGKKPMHGWRLAA